MSVPHCSAQVLAGALKDNGRARTVAERTSREPENVCLCRLPDQG